MRSLFLDELYPEEIAKVHEHLQKNAKPSGLEGLYWIFLPLELLTEPQRAVLTSEDIFSSYHVAVEVGVDWVRFELLLRGESMENIGAAQANEEQTLYILRFAHEMAQKLDLRTCL